MGLWIRLQPVRGELRLNRFEELLSELFGVLETDTKMLSDGRAVKLLSGDLEPNDSHPVIEYSQKECVVYLNWSDNRFCHIFYLVQTILGENELEGHCYDGYHHPNQKAIEGFFDFAGLKNRRQDPSAILLVLQSEMLGQSLRHIEGDSGDTKVVLGESVLDFDEEDWTGPELDASEWDSLSVDWRGKIRFLLGSEERASLRASVDDWTLVNGSGQVLLLGPRGGGILRC